jgi:hypothetical protein
VRDRWRFSAIHRSISPVTGPNGVQGSSRPQE